MNIQLLLTRGVDVANFAMEVRRRLGFLLFLRRRCTIRGIFCRGGFLGFLKIHAEVVLALFKVVQFRFLASKTLMFHYSIYLKRISTNTYLIRTHFPSVSKYPCPAGVLKPSKALKNMIFYLKKVEDALESQWM